MVGRNRTQRREGETRCPKMLNGPERKSTQREKFVLFVLFSVRGKSRPTETQLVHRGTKTNRVGGVKLISEYLQYYRVNNTWRG